MRAPRIDQNESIITTSSTTPVEPVGFDTAAAVDDGGDSLEITLPWVEGDRIPVQFTCKGSNISPSLELFGLSPQAVGVAIVMYKIGIEQTVDLIVANLDPARAVFDVGAFDAAKIPAGAVVGLNDPSPGPGPTQGYRGPCPQDGKSGTYTVEVHAQGQLIELPSGTPAADLRSAIDLVSIQRAAVTAYAQ